MSCFKIPTFWWVLPAFLSAYWLPAQTLTLQQAFDAALQHHPAIQGAALQVQQQKQLLPAATAFDDPVVTVESPTGNFYTLGVTQSFSLPGVYRRQKALQKAHIARSESSLTVTQQDIKLQTALAYTEWQYQRTLIAQLEVQDSLLQELATAAERQFREGQIDAVAAQFARLQAASLRTRLRQSAQDATMAKTQLEALTGLSGNLEPEPLVQRPYRQNLPVAADSSLWQNNPGLETRRQEMLVAERGVAVAKSRGLPELTLGYINQGERNSPIGNRFNVGVTIPLWRKQYQSAADAARTGVEIARQDLGVQSLALETAYRQTLSEAEKNRQALADFEQQVLPAARAVYDAARRLFEGGLTDMVTYLRNRKDVFEVELDYWRLVREAQVTEIELQYLKGSL